MSQPLPKSDADPPKPTFPWLDGMKVSDLIGRFVALRNQRKITEDEHEKFVRENYLNEMEVIEQKLLEHLSQTGGDSIASSNGTAYRYVASSVTVSDQREFKRHVIGNEAWDMLEWRASKTSVLEHIEDGNPTPPGVNVSTIAKIGFRSPK